MGTPASLSPLAGLPTTEDPRAPLSKVSSSAYPKESEGLAGTECLCVRLYRFDVDTIEV